MKRSKYRVTKTTRNSSLVRSEIPVCVCVYVCVCRGEREKSAFVLYNTARETTDNVRKESASNHDDNDNNSEEDDGDDDDGADHRLERPRQESLRPPSRQHRSCRSEAVTQPIGGCSSSP